MKQFKNYTEIGLQYHIKHDLTNALQLHIIDWILKYFMSNDKTLSKLFFSP